jgi:glycosyltransferase involved in cell wall biosynthesis
MPVYNAQRYVGAAVESILSQSFADFEFLIIDDGSTDNSRKILETYAARDARIRLISRPNMGLVRTLNEMIDLARGELLARMDADDISLPGRFAAQIDYLGAHPEVVCVGTAVQVIDPAGRPIFGGHPGMDHEALVERALDGCCPLSHPSVMMRRSAVLDVGAYRAEFMLAEDLDLWLRLAEVGRLANLDQVLVKYRMHPSSVSEKNQALQRERTQEALLDACARRGISSREVVWTTWRPSDRRSRAGYFDQLGWLAFNRGDRATAVEYAARALFLSPLRRPSWKLLACALVKRPRAAAPPPGGAEEVDPPCP